VRLLSMKLFPEKGKDSKLVRRRKAVEGVEHLFV
jgi:hypothetical protein